jgi:glutamyl-tRNA synthetase
MTDYRALAQLLYPHVTRTPDDLFRQYPPRALPPGAQVTRFAPSPTGFVHIGSVFTSMVSRRVAHQTGGVFILRIEDTDKKREQDGSIEAIVRNLNNFGLTPDEGIVAVDPEVVAGDYGPYVQSERIDIYDVFAKYLVERGAVYPAFDTEEELDQLRKTQEAQKVKPGYYGTWATWRDATLEQVKERLDRGERPVIRIRAPYPADGRVKFQDVIKGELDLPINDQDAVLIKSNRLPTYHFAYLIDDRLMGVNLVIRGDEWLPSAPLHLQLYEALGFPVPRIAHVAPIAKMEGDSKRKLSKRKDPEANMAYYAEQGYPEQAVTEYLLNLANSSFYDWRKANPTAPNTEFQIKLEDLGKASPLFDIVKLNDISKDVVATYTAEQVYEYGLAWAKQYNPRLAAILEADPAYSISVFNVERTGQSPRKDIVNWADIDRACGFFFDELYNASIEANGYPFPKMEAGDIKRILDAVHSFDPSVPKDAWLEGMRALGEEIGYARDAKSYKKNPTAYKGQFGDVMMVVRAALTGRTNSPDLYTILQTIGTARAKNRAARAREFIEKSQIEA